MSLLRALEHSPAEGTFVQRLTMNICIGYKLTLGNQRKHTLSIQKLTSPLLSGRADPTEKESVIDNKS